MGAEQGTTPVAGRYRLLSVVGRGGMGTVWRAHDLLLDRHVAVKEVALRGSLQHPRLRDRVLAEARAAAHLGHPGVPAVHDVVEQDGHPWIVMELIDGDSLRDILRREGTLPPRRAAVIGRRLLAVLRTAHAAGLLHRDVKPGNVLITPRGRVVLTDFGLALDGPDGGGPLECSPAYVSPEQARGEPLTPAADLWSLGALLYATVEGRPPYERDGVLPSLLAVLMDPYPPPEHAGELRPVIDGLLRRDPAERLDAATAARMLGEIGRGTGPADLAVLPPKPRHRLTRTVATVTGVAAVASAMAVGGAWAARWSGLGSGQAALVGTAGAAAGTIGYRQPDEFRVDVPIGWTRLQDGGAIVWQDPAGPRSIRIIPAAGDPLTGLRAAESAQRPPDYHRLRLEQEPDLADHGAQWEYTYQRDQTIRVLDSRVDGYDLTFSAPDAQWTRQVGTIDAVLNSFHAEQPS